MALTFRQRTLLATPLPAAWMSQVVIHNVYVKFYTDVIGLDPQYVGWVYLAFNVWNVLNDPVFGVLLDKMRYREGKGKFVRVMRITVPFMLLGLVAMAWTSPSWPEAMILAVFLAELFLFDVASTFYLIAATSYTYLAAPNREERINVEVIKTWMANIFSAFATIVATQLLVGEAITWAQLKADAVSILRMRAFWSWFVYGMTALAPMGMYFTAYLYFMDHVIESTGTQATVSDTGSMVVVLLLLPLLARVITRIGSRTSVFLGMIPYIAGLAGLFWVTQWWQVLSCYVVLMSGRYMMSTAGVPLEAALIDDNERATGTRKTGSFAALKALMSAPVTGSQMAIYMAIISAYGYDQLAETQDATAQFGIRSATAGIPIAFCVIGALALIFLPYSKAKEADLSRFSEEQRGEGTAFKTERPAADTQTKAAPPW